MPKIESIISVQEIDTGGDPRKSPFTIWFSADDHVTYGVRAKKRDRWNAGDFFEVKKVYKSGTNERGQWKFASIEKPQNDGPEHISSAVQRAIPQQKAGEFVRMMLEKKVSAYFAARRIAFEKAGLKEPEIEPKELLTLACHIAGPTIASLQIGLERGTVVPTNLAAEDGPPPVEDDPVPF